VAASGARVDGEVIAGEMMRLFGRQAAERKRLLNDALAKRVPAARVEVLRRSLAGPTALAALSMPPPIAAPDAKEAPESPAIVSPAASPVAPSTATRSGVIASVVLGLVLAAGIVAVTARMTRSAAPMPAPALTALAIPATDPPVLTSLPPAPAGVASAVPVPSVANPTSSPASPSTPPHRRPKPAPSGHARTVDVDTNPL
jgi:hypothetical protein